MMKKNFVGKAGNFKYFLRIDKRIFYYGSVFFYFKKEHFSVDSYGQIQHKFFKS